MVKLQHLLCPGSTELSTQQKINLIRLAVRDQGHGDTVPRSLCQLISFCAVPLPLARA